jgi:ABC-type bacteriocin/lantibiotic exporter with double-glycine peptidase domain
LANLLSVFFGCATDEDAVTDQGAARDGYDAVAEDSLEPGRRASLGALLESARRLGFDAAVYQMDAALLQLALAEVRVPVIGLLRESAGHFVIAVGQVYGDTLVFDPALGFRILPQKHLLEKWSGFTLVVDPGAERIDVCSARVPSLIDRFEQRRRFLDELAWIVR